METTDAIYFYGHKNDLGFLSNFYPCKFIDENKIKFSCSEQYFMYNKAKLFDSNNIQLLNEILTETDPAKIKKLGRKVKNYDETIWSKERYQIMKNGIKMKFTQNLILKNKLLSTGTKKLYEASQFDNVWGDWFRFRTRNN